MSNLIINSFEDFEKLVGTEIGVSNYLKVTQEQINQFAKSTLDHQWIHVDEERAKRESPYNATIAHGYLSIALLPYLWEQIVDVRNTKMLVNYGIENLRFNHPVIVDNEVRIRVKLKSIVNLRGITKAYMDVIMEIKDNKKSAFDGTIIFLYHFLTD